jgi:hypothetical protein
MKDMICVICNKIESNYNHLIRIMNEQENQFMLFKLNDKEEDFEKIELDDKTLLEVLESHSIYIIVDPIDKRLWIWKGKNVSIRMKFIASQKGSSIRDSYGIDYKICSVDEEDESQEFKHFINLL